MNAFHYKPFPHKCGDCHLIPAPLVNRADVEHSILHSKKETKRASDTHSHLPLALSEEVPTLDLEFSTSSRAPEVISLKFMEDEAWS